ncbi:MAG: hypothetical protein KC643_28970 [Nitrospira sp.]|nr:hypothetical protein [Nitrospira sp.]
MEKTNCFHCNLHFPNLVFGADVTGTNGNDILFSQGSPQVVSTTLTNPYSGASVSINGTFNVNIVTYDGLNGIDTLFITNLSDLILPETGGVQSVANVERLVAASGADIINFASTSYSLGNMFIDGGLDRDIIWANAGNDTIRGFDGDDLIDGGPGNDILQGQNGNDILDGGEGNDTLNGGLNQDILHGDNGNDILQFTSDFIRPDRKNGSYDIFNGGAGYDTIVATTGPDAIVAWDDVNPFHPEAPPTHYRRRRSEWWIRE